jgi:DNA-binding NtrC family response regulator
VPSVGIALAGKSFMTMNDTPNKSILIVDDDARMLCALEKVLRGEGMTVIPAFEASEAVEVLTQRKRRVDLVITDLRMPFVNGITLLYAIHEMLPAMPVIVLTAFGEPDVRSECFRQGAAAFLEKPMDSQRLVKTINKVLRSVKEAVRTTDENNNRTRP